MGPIELQNIIKIKNETFCTHFALDRISINVFYVGLIDPGSKQR